MRKFQRQITDFEEIIALLDSCDTIRLGLLDSPYPYVVPLSFGYEVKNGKLYIYFHCAREGKKLELIKRDNRVCVEADRLNSYVDRGDSVTADYASVIAFGTAELVTGEECVRGLELLLEHCRIKGHSAAACAARDITAVVKITVDEITGKRRFPLQ
ncbi:MAG: pyridoxamine 5'-phosphate oxidase family protein [Clostridia bacterium]|nr:pyridoxamine 5'-phosphate oxidase family protein [Clostridia bacterium]